MCLVRTFGLLGRDWPGSSAIGSPRPPGAAVQALARRSRPSISRCASAAGDEAQFLMFAGRNLSLSPACLLLPAPPQPEHCAQKEQENTSGSRARIHSCCPVRPTWPATPAAKGTCGHRCPWYGQRRRSQGCAASVDSNGNASTTSWSPRVIFRPTAGSDQILNHLDFSRAVGPAHHRLALIVVQSVRPSESKSKMLHRPPRPCASGEACGWSDSSRFRCAVQRR